jgi:hypothetical protein
MRRLDRYLLREFLVPLGFCLGGFLIFWIAFDLFSNLHELQNKKLHGLDVAEYYVFQVPEFFILVLPIALLLALLYALTNHSRHNEITAIRADYFHVYKRVVNVDADFVRVATVTDPTADMNTFTPGIHVKVRVAAVNKAGESQRSEPVEAVVS